MRRFRLALQQGVQNIDAEAESSQESLSVLDLADNVDLDNKAQARTRKGRQLRLAASAPHSFWVNPKDDSQAWFVEGSVLKRLNADYTATELATLSSDQPLRYLLLNEEIVASNGSDIGWLTASEFVPFSASSSDEFVAAMPAGQYLAFYRGSLVVASGSTLYVSKPWNAEERDTRYSQFPMSGAVRMLGAVEDGLWVATDKHVVFLSGQGPDEWTYQERSAKVPADGCFGTGFAVEGKETVMRVYWAADAFYEGRAGGSLTNLSDGRVRLPSGSSGLCFSRENNGISQVIALIRSPEDGNISVDDDLSVNTLYS